jgi:tRNA G18 (ribose-2'-O)-methylase SpoU
MKNKQLTHQQVNFKNSSKLQIFVFLDKIDSPANLGSIFRNAEAFDVDTIWLRNENKKDLDSNRFKRTSRSTEKNLNIEYYKDFQTVFDDFKGLMIGLEITSNSENIVNINQTVNDKVLVVLGNEKFGIQKTILQRLDKVYHIEMYGNNSSMNVSQTLGITLHELRRRV